jgi:PST family polysaccharide transporter
MSSHRQIFKSTALIGGTQVINMAIGIMRTKVLAMLLGPAGMGLAGLYTAATGLIGSVTGLGLNASGVRQIGEAAGTNDEIRIARTAVTLRRISLFSGVLGMSLVLAMAPLLSRTTFGDDKHVFGICLMSLTLLFGGISAGQGALLQGLRRLRDMAASQILGTIFGAVVSMALVWWLREDGIPPFLVAISVFGILLSWWYVRKVKLMEVTVSWNETFRESRALLGLGLAFTVSGLVGAATAYLTRILIQRQLGMSAVGIYAATSALSTFYVGFVLQAMGTDLVPRLTAAIHEHSHLNRLVNEQTEMGVLIAVPGVLATLTFAPWVMQLLYSSEFVSGAGVARWQILGVFLRVVSWPLGYVLIAKGEGLFFCMTELLAGIVGVALVYVCVKWWQLEGVGIYLALQYVFYSSMMVIVVRRLTGFRWSATALTILVPGIISVGVSFIGIRLLPLAWGLAFGIVMTMVSGIVSLHVLQELLGLNLLERIRAKIGLLNQNGRSS